MKTRPYKFVLDTNAIFDLVFAEHLVTSGVEAQQVAHSAAGELRSFLKRYRSVVQSGSRRFLLDVESAILKRARLAGRLLSWHHFFANAGGAIEVLAPSFVRIEGRRLDPEFVPPSYVGNGDSLIPAELLETALEAFRAFPAVEMADAMVYASAGLVGGDVLVTNDEDFRHDGFGLKAVGNDRFPPGCWVRKHIPNNRPGWSLRGLIDHRGEDATDVIQKVLPRHEAVGEIEAVDHSRRDDAHSTVAQRTLRACLSISPWTRCVPTIDCRSNSLKIYASHGIVEGVRVTHVEFGYGKLRWDVFGNEQMSQAVELWNTSLEREWRRKVAEGEECKRWYVPPREAERSQRAGYILVSLGLADGHSDLTGSGLRGPFVLS